MSTPRESLFQHPASVNPNDPRRQVVRQKSAKLLPPGQIRAEPPKFAQRCNQRPCGPLPSLLGDVEKRLRCRPLSTDTPTGRVPAGSPAGKGQPVRTELGSESRWLSALWGVARAASPVARTERWDLTPQMGRRPELSISFPFGGTGRRTDSP